MDPMHPGPDAALLSEEVLVELQQGLAMLKEREREALALRFAAGLKFADVGVVLGITEGAAKMLVAGAVARR